MMTCQWKLWRVNACSCALLQVNQIGTVTESIQAALDSKAAGWGVMVSHRSGETEDNFIADLSVGLASGQVGNLRFYCEFLAHMGIMHVKFCLYFMVGRSKQELHAAVRGWPSIIR